MTIRVADDHRRAASRRRPLIVHKKLVLLADLAGIVTAVAVLAVMLLSGSAGAPAAKRVLRFQIRPGTQDAVALDPVPAGLPAGDSGVVLALGLVNRGAQLGQPAGAGVGRVVLTCAVSTSIARRLCSGIVQLPGGSFDFGGNGPSSSGADRYAITTGVGRYASAVGRVTVTSRASGPSSVVVTLDP